MLRNDGALGLFTVEIMRGRMFWRSTVRICEWIRNGLINSNRHN